jgi:hypothetical protein
VVAGLVDALAVVVLFEVHLGVRRAHRELQGALLLLADLGLGLVRDVAVGSRDRRRLHVEQRLVERQPGVDPADFLGELVAAA